MRRNHDRRLKSLERRPKPRVIGERLAAALRAMDVASAVEPQPDEHYEAIGRQIAERARRLALGQL